MQRLREASEMKIERQEEKFRPITIILESEDEALLLGAALSSISVDADVDANLLYNIYREILREVGSPSDTFQVVKSLAGLRVEKR